MVNNSLTHGRSQAGFTLVELAIVMIIIGLLIGGILKGQELIGNAQVTATVAQVKSIETATTTFRDMYSAMPGDMLGPGNRLPNCVAAPCSTAGTGNGRVDLAADVAETNADDESLRYWNHLRAADLLGGLDGTTTVGWGAAFPAAEIGGGFTIGTSAGGGAGLTGASNTARAGHYLSMRSTAGTAVAASAANAGLSSTQAARIDRKMDDGQADNGTVLGAGSDGAAATNCMNGAAYNENFDGLSCQLYIRIQQ